ncbi:MAG TPA: thiamine phosphate synthase [Acidobacteriaceae bacterium]|nr:thiamine phosphate synthase [Acidobacteriaceae bacterium]
MLLYTITSRKLLPGDDAARRQRLVELARGWASGGVDYIQIREKDLPLSELQALAVQIVEAVRGTGAATRVLVNGPAQVALDAGADGVHMPATPATTDASGNPQLLGAAGNAVRAAHQVYERAGKEAIVSAACHSAEEIRRAAGASLMLFSPVFEKVTGQSVASGHGLAALRAAVDAAAPAPVIALGGVTEKNAAACVENGAAGIAAIRLFMGDAWRSLAAGRSSR